MTTRRRMAEFVSREIREHRKALGLTQEDFGLLAGVQQSTVRSWEKGLNIPRLEHLAALAIADNIELCVFVPSLADLRDEDADPKAPGS